MPQLTFAKPTGRRTAASRSSSQPIPAALTATSTPQSRKARVSSVHRLCVLPSLNRCKCVGWPAVTPAPASTAGRQGRIVAASAGGPSDVFALDFDGVLVDSAPEASPRDVNRHYLLLLRFLASSTKRKDSCITWGTYYNGACAIALLSVRGVEVWDALPSRCENFWHLSS